MKVELLKNRYDESVGQKNALMEESQMLQVIFNPLRMSPIYEYETLCNNEHSKRTYHRVQPRMLSERSTARSLFFETMCWRWLFLVPPTWSL